MRHVALQAIPILGWLSALAGSIAVVWVSITMVVDELASRRPSSRREAA